MREQLRDQAVVDAIALHMNCANLRVKKIAIDILITLCQARTDHYRFGFCSSSPRPAPTKLSSSAPQIGAVSLHNDAQGARREAAIRYSL